MKKGIKLVFFSLIFILSLFLSSCRYKMPWDEKINEIGETEFFIISLDDKGEYYISGFTNRGLEAKMLNIPKTAIIDDNEYKISYVDDIFINHKYVRTLIINISSDNISINGCKSLRAVQISQDNLKNPDSFFKGLSNINVYITNNSYLYDEEAFGNNNYIYYEHAPKLSSFDSLTTYEYIIFGVVAIASILAIIGIGVLIWYLKENYYIAHYKFLSIICSLALIIYIIGSITLIIIGKDNLIYVKGLIFLIPVSFTILECILKKEMEDNLAKIFTIGIILSIIITIVGFIIIEAPIIIPLCITSLVIIAILIIVLRKIYDSTILFYLFAIIALVITVPSVYLSDLLIKLILSNLIGFIISIIILLALLSFMVFKIIKSKMKNKKEKENNDIPLPKFYDGKTIFLKVGPNFYWTKAPECYVRNNILFITGRIKSNKIFNSIEESDQEIKESEPIIWDSIKPIMGEYFNNYPDCNITDVNILGIEINIKYKR